MTSTSCRPTWSGPSSSWTWTAGAAQGLPFRETDGHCCLPLVRLEVIPPPGLGNVLPQHVQQEGRVLEPVPCRVPDGAFDGVPNREAEAGPPHEVLP